MKRKIRFRPKKRLGQHFIIDRQIIHRILSRARFRPSDVVLEIGPGKGALTLPLSRWVKQVIAVEKDAGLGNLLRARLAKAGIDNVDLVNEDILKWDFPTVEQSSSERLQLIGNLPYNISSPFLEKLIENRHRIDRAVLMFQKEVAMRLTAPPGKKSYGALTLSVRYYAHAAPLVHVSREAFRPRPKVDSVVLELDFRKPHPRRAVDEDRFRRILKGAFSHRRKTLGNALKEHFPAVPPGVFLSAMNRCGISQNRRAETLDMDDFLCLASAIELR